MKLLRVNANEVTDSYLCLKIYTEEMQFQYITQETKFFPLCVILTFKPNFIFTRQYKLESRLTSIYSYL